MTMNFHRIYEGINDFFCVLFYNSLSTFTFTSVHKIYIADKREAGEGKKERKKKRRLNHYFHLTFNIRERVKKRQMIIRIFT